ncbi:MAG: efflux RND transporter permease subunit [Leptospira sp.]|nr:efflux RND transporter permease subunit [Leptospira sp.]
MKVNYSFPILCALNLIGILILPGLRIRGLNYQENAYWLQIEILYPGADIFTVEKEISIPIETIIKQVQGYKNFESQSVPGKSISFLQFASLDILEEKKRKIRNLIFENLHTFPKRANTPQISHTSKSTMPGFVFRYLNPKSDIGKTYEEEIRSFFESLYGVHSIQFSENESDEIVVEIFESILKTWKLQPREILSALNGISYPFAVMNSNVYPLLEIHSLGKFSKAEVYLPNRGKVKLDSFSKISLEKKTLNKSFRWNGKEENLILVYTDSDITNLLLMPRIFSFLWNHQELEIIFNPTKSLFIDFIFLIVLSILIDIYICSRKSEPIPKISIWYFYSILIQVTSIFIIFDLEFSVVELTVFVFVKLLYVSFHFQFLAPFFAFYRKLLFSPIQEADTLFYKLVFIVLFAIIGILEFFRLPYHPYERAKQNSAILDFPPGKNFSESNRITKQVEDEILSRGLTKSMTVQSESGQSKFYLELEPEVELSQFKDLPVEDGYFYFPQGGIDTEEYVIWFFHENLETLRNIAKETILTFKQWGTFSEVLQMFKPPYISSVENWDEHFTSDLGIRHSDLMQNQKLKLTPPIFEKVSFKGKLTDVRMRIKPQKILDVETNLQNDRIHLDSLILRNKEWIPDRIQRKNQSRALGIVARGVDINFNTLESFLKDIKNQRNIGFGIEKRIQNEKSRIAWESILCFLFVSVLILAVAKFTNLRMYGIFFVVFGAFGLLSLYIQISLSELILGFVCCILGIAFLYTQAKTTKFNFLILQNSILFFVFCWFVLVCLPFGTVLFHLFSLGIVIYFFMTKFHFFMSK